MFATFGPAASRPWAVSASPFSSGDLSCGFGEITTSPLRRLEENVLRDQPTAKRVADVHPANQPKSQQRAAGNGGVKS
jgi:hypothetical protein